MFFIIEVTSGAHDLGLRRCGFFPCCSGGGAMAPVTYTFQQFTLFFIPLFRFGKRFFVTCPSCGAVYELAKDEGHRIEKDPMSEINPDKMYILRGASRKNCPNCGRAVDPSSRYCPNCGTRLM